MGDYDKDRQRRWRQRVDREAMRGKPKAKAPRASKHAKAARILGLSIEVDSEYRLVFSGHVAGATVEVTRVKRTAKTYEWTIVLLRAGVDTNLKIGKETTITRAKKVIGGDDILVGERDFDDRVYIGGDPGRMIATLDVEMRTVVTRLIDRGARVEDGALTMVRRTNQVDAVPSHLRRNIEDAAKLLRRLSMETNEIRRNLVVNARNEDSPTVRMANIDRLRAEFVDDVGSLDWRLEPAAPTDLAWRIALMSRRTATDEIARWANDRNLGARDRMMFLSLLERRLPEPGAVDGLEQQINGPIAGAALRILMRHLDDAPVVRDLRLATLVALLNESGSSERIVLAKTLGAVGGGAAIEALLPYTSGFMLSREVKLAARRAVAAIEQRSTQRRGQLSVTTGEDAGRLSMSGEAGELSLEPQS